MLGLENKVAMVTGAANGIGRAILERFVAEKMRVVAVDLDFDALRETCAHFPDDVIPVAANIASRDQVVAAVRTAVDRFGALDILAANAGIADGEPFLEINDASWQRIIDVNITGTFHCLQEAARAMAPNRSGAIVCTSSTNAWYVEKNLAHYNTSKGGVEALVCSAAIDLAEYGIRVNAIEPSMVKTRAAFITTDPVGGSRIFEAGADGPFCRTGRDCGRGRLVGLRPGQLHHRSDADSRRRPDPGNRYAIAGHAAARLGPSRRDLMISRRSLLSSAVAAPVFGARARAADTLYVLGWPGYADQGMLDRFTAITGIGLVVDLVSSYDEIFARLWDGFGNPTR